MLIYFFHDVDSNIIIFFTENISFNAIDLNNINLDDVNFDEDDPETINYVRLVTWRNRFKQRKACKKENACSMASKKMVGLTCFRR